MTFARQQKLLEIHTNQLSLHTQPSHTSDFWTSPLSKTPSNDVLSKCFLTEFLKHEQLYLKDMTSKPVGGSISFDHTFKVATNIGYLREDGRWISEYDGLFIVLNEQGKVLSWQLTKGTAFAHVKTLLSDLLERPQQRIHTVYVDDCCKLRAKIKSVFGSTEAVKLDLFHAVQRITKTLSKKHGLVQQCMVDLRRVFRCDGDSEEKRLSHTPPPDIIFSKLEEFLAKWKDVVDANGVKLLKSDTLTAINNLKRHISSGCLSGIPPGAGTNRNERLHEHVNSFFNRSRIGILLAYALLTTIFYSHNNATKLKGKNVVRPIVACSLQPTLATTMKPIGIMPKERIHDPEQADQWEMDMSNNSEDFSSIVPIFHTSLQKLQLKISLKKMKLMQITKSIKEFQQFTSVVNLTKDSDPNVTTLSEFGLVLAPAPRDGNCFFHSLSMNIMSNQEIWTNCLTKIGCDNDKPDITSLSAKLRQAFVNEILGERRDVYQNFLTSDLDYSNEANKFLQEGFYSSSLGDLMPLAMATVLQASIIIITTNPHSHPMYVIPQVGCMEGTIILVYEPTGPGHYDAALPYSSMIEQATTNALSQTVTCRCRVNKKNVRKICAPSGIYTSRCRCYLKSQSCTSKCSCKHCSNPSFI